MARNSGAAPGVGLAGTENRIGLGVSANPSLPPGLGMGSGMPRGLGNPTGNSLNGMAESTGSGLNSAISAIIKSMGASGGSNPNSSRGPRAPEKPSVARSGAIARRLNGGASRGTELKGL